MGPLKNFTIFFEKETQRQVFPVNKAKILTTAFFFRTSLVAASGNKMKQGLTATEIYIIKLHANSS